MGTEDICGQGHKWEDNNNVPLIKWIIPLVNVHKKPGKVKVVIGSLFIGKHKLSKGSYYFCLACSFGVADDVGIPKLICRQNNKEMGGKKTRPWRNQVWRDFLLFKNEKKGESLLRHDDKPQWNSFPTQSILSDPPLIRHNDFSFWTFIWLLFIRREACCYTVGPSPKILHFSYRGC